MSQPRFIKRKEMMEYYFSGTIERIILKILAVFFESSCSTLAIPMPKTLMILRLL